MASIYANLLKQKKAFAPEKSATPTGLVWNTNMAVVLLFRDINMAAVKTLSNVKTTSFRSECLIASE